jgi:hypothetical protein
MKVKLNPEPDTRIRRNGKDMIYRSFAHEAASMLFNGSKITGTQPETKVSASFIAYVEILG